MSSSLSAGRCPTDGLSKADGSSRHEPERALQVLVVEDDEGFGSALIRHIERRGGCAVRWAQDLAHARKILSTAPVDLVLADVRLPDGDGCGLIAERADDAQQWLTVFLTGYADVRKAVAAMKQGAFDFIEKPFGPDRLQELLERAAAHCRQQLEARELRHWLAVAQSTEETIVGRSPAMVALRQQLRHVARVPADVLVIGETGTGKDLITRRLHELSGRKGPFVALNCGAIPDALFESELFGHQAGSFTGANRSTVGKIEQANHGTLFLDEIESMPMNQQVKLLRVLETRCVERVGAREEVALDLRVVAASKEHLEARCREGLFRLDLWHRLNVVTLSIPPLRKRVEDVPLLFADSVAQACRRFGVPEEDLGGPSLATLMAYSWPGNVRELKHAAERFVLGMPPLPEQGVAETPLADLNSQLGALEREIIRMALHRNQNDLSATASELGVSGKTLSRRLAEYDLRRGQGGVSA